MGFIKARGGSLYYEDKGEGLPIPPVGATASTWGALVGDLAGVGRVIAYDRRGYSRSGVRLSGRPRRMRWMPQRSWKHWRPDRRWRSGRAPGRPSRWNWRSADRIWSAGSSRTRHPGGRCGIPARRAWARWRGCSGWHAEAATRRQPKPLLRWVYSYRDGGSARDEFPEAWRRTARENARSVVADLRATLGSYPRAGSVTWRTSPCPWCARTAREAAATCAPSHAR